ncbi:MAG TPA: hypothetical protein VFC73_07825 [Syntrophomonadaceae bacterium]|nr:hypothetical protein [Syntrophomonadaceae bacterium]
MSSLEKAVNLLKGLSSEKLDIALHVIESLAIKEQVELFDKEELTLEEVTIVNNAIRELENGLGVEAEDVWKEAGI